MQKQVRIFVGVCGAILCAALPTSLPAQSAGQDAVQDELRNARRTRQLTSELMSPYCPNRTLAECPDPRAEVERQKVRRWIDAGVGEEEIKTRLDQELGPLLSANFSRDPSRPAFEPTISAVPSGYANLVVPALLLAAGAIGLALILLRMQRGSRAQSATGGASAESASDSQGAMPVSKSELRAIEAELDAELEARGIGGRPPRA